MSKSLNRQSEQAVISIYLLQKSVNQLQTFYDTVILSPHLDDAVLSCGGQIYLKTAAGQSVLILTLMAGEPTELSLSPYAQSLHDRWQLKSNTVAMRRREDKVAIQFLGADFLHWGIPDCIYRREPQTGEPCYTSDKAILGEINQYDSKIIDHIAERLRSLPQCKQLFVPLGVGNHVDHQITRLAAEQADCGEPIYYEEFPYAIDSEALAKIIDKNRTAWRAETISIPEKALAAKIKAISAYVSQLSSFFVDLDDLDHQVRIYAQTVGGERYWHRNPAHS